MRLKKLMRNCLYSLVAGTMIISATAIDVNAIEEATIAAKVQSMIESMTVEEKVAQMIQPETADIAPEEVAKYGFGSILSGGGSAPSTGNTLDDWVTRLNSYQEAIINAGKIPLIYGVDAVHGNNNVYGATVFPHNIGLGAANDIDLVKEIGEVVASETIAIGANWTFAPMLGVPHNERWGRTYESFGDSAERVAALGTAYIEGIQSSQQVLATAKHYLGEGITTNGVNQGEVTLSDEDYQDLINAKTSNPIVNELLTPYIDAIKNDVASVMISYNSINGIKCHGNDDLITTLLKENLGFDGIVISDYNGIDQITTASSYTDKAIVAVNAGLDMLMVAGSEGNQKKWKVAYDGLVAAVENGQISEERINDACTRILTQKYKLGIMEDPSKAYASQVDQATFGSDEHRALAREAVAESLTLLKNTQLTDDQTMMQALQGMTKVVVAGSNAHDLGNQCGGWTIAWQGQSGNTCTEGTTIYQGISAALKAQGGSAIYAKTGYFEDEDVEAAVVVVGETPYAESNGDATANSLKLSSSDLKTIQTIEDEHPGLPIVLVLVTGRPLTIANQVTDENIKAIVSAWLPGTEGAGVADVLFGEQDFTGTNPITWPWYASDIDTKLEDSSKVLYATGYGLTKSEVSTIGDKPDDPSVVVFNETGTTRLEAETFYDSYSASDQIILENNNTTVGNLRVGSYLLYKISTSKDAAYDLVINANANTDQANAFQLYVDDQLILDNTMTVPGQGDWTTFKELSLGTVSIPAGEHILKLLAKTKDFNLDWYEFTVNEDAEYVAPKDPEPAAPNVGTGALLEEGAVKVTMSSSENSGSMDWYAANQKIENKNTEKESLDLRTVDDSTITTINVDATTEYNTFLGMGTSIDESTVNNLWKMDEDARYAFIKRLVDPVNGSGDTLFRLTIGTPDFVACPFYTYYDGTGTELDGEPDWYNETGNGFTIQKDIDYHIIDTIKLIQKAAEECGVADEITFFASPWTPPGWMKIPTSSSNSYSNNELLLKGGKLSDDHIEDAAKYYVRYIEEYQKLGIPIYAMTLQNEPMLEIDYPSCYITADQEAQLAIAIKAELAKSTILSDEEKDVKIWAFDHNPGDLNSYMNTVYGAAIDAVDGAAVHDYGGELSNMTTLHNNYEDKTIHLTERSVWGTTGMDRIAQYFRNYAESYNCWVTMLDSNIQTHQWVGTPDPTAFVQDAENPNNYWATPEVYLMGQFSKYIRPGDVRVYSNYGSSNTITNVVFKHHDDETNTDQLIMVAINNTDSDQNFKVVQGGVQFNATLPAKNCATYIWTAADGEVTGLSVPGTLEVSDAKDVVGMDQNTYFENVTAGAHATYLVDVKEAGYYNVSIEHSIGATDSNDRKGSNFDNKELVLYADGKEIGSTITKRFDTWTESWNAWGSWGTYNYAQIQVYLEKGVQNITIQTNQESINIGRLIFTKADTNTVPGYVDATNYSYAENVIVENFSNIGFVEEGDLFEYRLNIQKTGTYALKMNYACETETGTNFDLYLDGELLKENVVLPQTGTGWNDYTYGIVEDVDLPEGENTLRFVINENGGFNLQSFSFGAYIDVTALDLTEGALTNQKITVKLVDGTFIEKLDADQITLSGPLADMPFSVTRVSDNELVVTLNGEASQDFDSNQTIQLSIDASQIGDEGYVLSDQFDVVAVNDNESLESIAIPFEATSFNMVINGGTFNSDITVDDLELSDSLKTYFDITAVKVVNGQLNVTISREGKKTNYAEIAGTIAVKPTGYSDGTVSLEADVVLAADPVGPTPIIVSDDTVAKLTLDKAYNNSGSLANASGGEFENYYLDVKDAGDYILSFDITNDAETSGALSINGGKGIDSTNNLASLSFGRYWNNTNVSYKTMIHYDEPGLYTLQLRANVVMKLTNATLTKKPAATTIEDSATITVDSLIDGSDDKLWAIENSNAIGYTGSGAYQDYYVDVQNGGKYSFSISYATTGTDSIAELISVVDGKETSLGTIDLASTGDWTPYKNSNSIIVDLPSGEQILRLKVANGGFNSNAINLQKVIIGQDAEVYINTNKTINEILGLKVVLDGEDVTDTATIETDFDPSR